MLLGLEETHITTTLGLGGGILSILSLSLSAIFLDAWSLEEQKIAKV